MEQINQENFTKIIESASALNFGDYGNKEVAQQIFAALEQRGLIITDSIPVEFAAGISIDSMTKPNFWDRMKQAYPVAMTRFCEWVDDYKKAHRMMNSAFHLFQWYKYHDLPIAFQIGIFIQYSMESGNRYPMFIDLEGQEVGKLFRDRIEQYFYHEQQEINTEERIRNNINEDLPF